MRFFLVVFLSALLLLGVAGPSASAQEQTKKRGTIGVSLLTLTNPFFLEMGDHMKAEAAKQGFEVVVVSADFDVAKQQNQVKDFIVTKVDAIVLSPADSKAIGPAIREANAAGIPVFTADIAALDPEAKVVTHVATDNYSGGLQAGEAMIEALGGEGAVAILDHPEVESVLLRTKGFEEAIKKANASGAASIRIVAKLPGGGAREKSFKAMEDILQAHPDVQGVFAINDPSALGARAALEKAGKAPAVKIVGFDGQPEGKKAIRDGALYADPIQFPDKIGQETVRAIFKYLEGEEVPPTILIPTSLYRQADAKKDASIQ